MKFVFPIVWISLFGFGTSKLWWSALVERNADFPAHMKYEFLGLWLVGTFFILRNSFRIKRVRIDNGNLYISNYFHEVVVPFEEIARVTENRLMNIHPVTVDLRNATKFGKRITFMPTLLIVPFASHPIVERLQLLAIVQGKV